MNVTADFAFKQFSLKQKKGVMPLSTDAILLGCWAAAESTGRLLDAGCGNGILSLMMAQRFPGLKIVAVDLSKDAVSLCSENIVHSPWRGRISVIHENIIDFQTEDLFDHIICNPPFFLNSLLSPNPGINKSKHIADFSAETLMLKASELVRTEGKLSVITEYSSGKALIYQAEKSNLSLSRITFIKSKPTKAPFRVLAEFQYNTMTGVNLASDELCIHDNTGAYTIAFNELTKDFYR